MWQLQGQMRRAVMLPLLRQKDFLMTKAKCQPWLWGFPRPAWKNELLSIFFGALWTFCRWIMCSYTEEGADLAFHTTSKSLIAFSDGMCPDTIRGQVVTSWWEVFRAETHLAIKFWLFHWWPSASFPWWGRLGSTEESEHLSVGFPCSSFNIVWNTGHLLLDPVFVSTCIHFQILAYGINAKFSWGRVSGVKNWSWTPWPLDQSVSLFKKSCRTVVQWVSAVMHSRLVQTLKTRCKKHLHLISLGRVVSELYQDFWSTAGA